MQASLLELDQLYCLKSHLCERIVDVACHPSFSKLRFQMLDFIAQTENELRYLDVIYVILNQQRSFKKLAVLICDLEALFEQLTDIIDLPGLAHLAFWEYLYEVLIAQKMLLTQFQTETNHINNFIIDEFLLLASKYADCDLLKHIKIYYPESIDLYSRLLKQGGKV